MRVPTHHTATRQFEGIDQRLARQAALSTQLASGLRVSRPGDDPLAASQAELARSRLAALAQDQRASSLAQGLLANAEGALGRGVGALQSARELLVSASNGSYGPQDRQAMALQLRGLREELQSLAQLGDGAGGFVFGLGAATGGPPVFAPVQRIGDGGAPASLPGATNSLGAYATSIDGRAAFEALPQGNGVFLTSSAAANTGTGWVGAGQVSDPMQLTGHRYALEIGGAPGALTVTMRDLDTGMPQAPQPLLPPATLAVDGQQVRLEGLPAPGDTFLLAPAGRQDLLALIDDTLGYLEDAGLPTHLRNERLERSQAGLDRALENLSLLRTQVGTQLRHIEEAGAQNETQALQATTRRSQLRDADLARVVSELQLNQAGLEAALKTYASLGQASLMRLLP